MMENSNEKAVEHASNAVFALINPDNEDKLQKCDILRYMKTSRESELTNPLVHKTLKRALLRKAKDTDLIKRKDVVKVNERYMEGHLPRLPAKKTDSGECSSDDEEDIEATTVKDQPSVGAIGNVSSYFIHSGIVFKSKIYSMASKAGRTWLLSLVPTHQISTLTTFLILSYVVNAKFLSYFIPLMLFTLSLGTMIISTIRMLRGKKRFEEFSQWSTLLTIVVKANTVDTRSAEENYLLGHTSPFIQFWCSSLLAIFAYAARRDIWFFNAELFVLSAIMYISIVLVFKLYDNKWNCIALLAFFTATLFEGFNRFDGYFAGGIIFSIPISFLSITLNLSLSVILRGLCVVCVLQNFKKSNHTNKECAFYVDVAPTLVAILWWEFGTLFLAQSSFGAVFRAFFEAFSLVFAVPFLAVALISTTIYFVSSMDLSKVLMTLVLIGIPIVYGKFVKTDWKKTFHKAISNTIVKVVLTAVCVLFIGIAMLYYSPAGLEVKESKLTWGAYKSACVHLRPLKNGNYVQTAMVCEEFKGYHVHWEGIVRSVEMKSSENKLRTLLDHLPGAIANWIACIYGEEFPRGQECNTETNATFQYLCNVAKVSERKCYTFNYSLYKFTITIAMSDNTDEEEGTVDLEVGDDFKDLILSLKYGDKIGFKGIIASTSSTIKGKAIYKYSEGTTEPEEHLKNIADIKQALDVQLRSSINFILRFLFFPLIVFN